jgi:heterodisulfide reductase subunit C
MTTALDPHLAEEIERSGAFDAAACMNCGVCTAVCPMGLDLLPRKLFRYVLLGMQDQVLRETETIFSCLLCRLCEEDCPAGVHITDNVRALRHHIDRNVFRV